MTGIILLSDSTHIIRRIGQKLVIVVDLKLIMTRLQSSIGLRKQMSCRAYSRYKDFCPLLNNSFAFCPRGNKEDAPQSLLHRLLSFSWQPLHSSFLDSQANGSSIFPLYNALAQMQPSGHDSCKEDGRFPTFLEIVLWDRAHCCSRKLEPEQEHHRLKHYQHCPI